MPTKLTEQSSITPFSNPQNPLPTSASPSFSHFSEDGFQLTLELTSKMFPSFISKSSIVSQISEFYSRKIKPEKFTNTQLKIQSSKTLLSKLHFSNPQNPLPTSASPSSQSHVSSVSHLSEHDLLPSFISKSSLIAQIPEFYSSPQKGCESSMLASSISPASLVSALKPHGCGCGQLREAQYYAHHSKWLTNHVMIFDGTISHRNQSIFDNCKDIRQLVAEAEWASQASSGSRPLYSQICSAGAQQDYVSSSLAASRQGNSSAVWDDKSFGKGKASISDNLLKRLKSTTVPDFFSLALTVPQGFFVSNACSAPVPAWFFSQRVSLFDPLIHGLRKCPAPLNYPFASRYSEKENGRAVTREIERCWKPLMCKNYVLDKLVEHEYKKHGEETKLKQAEYIKFCLTKFNELNLIDIFDEFAVATARFHKDVLGNLWVAVQADHVWVSLSSKIGVNLSLQFARVRGIYQMHFYICEIRVIYKSYNGLVNDSEMVDCNEVPSGCDWVTDDAIKSNTMVYVPAKLEQLPIPIHKVSSFAKIDIETSVQHNITLGDFVVSGLRDSNLACDLQSRGIGRASQRSRIYSIDEEE